MRPIASPCQRLDWLELTPATMLVALAVGYFLIGLHWQDLIDDHSTEFQ